MSVFQGTADFVFCDPISGCYSIDILFLFFVYTFVCVCFVCCFVLCVCVVCVLCVVHAVGVLTRKMNHGKKTTM